MAATQIGGTPASQRALNQGSCRPCGSTKKGGDHPMAAAPYAGTNPSNAYEDACDYSVNAVIAQPVFCCAVYHFDQLQPRCTGLRAGG